MYKMIKAVTLDGIDKLEGIASIHSLNGYFLFVSIVGVFALFSIILSDSLTISLVVAISLVCFLALLFPQAQRAAHVRIK